MIENAVTIEEIAKVSRTTVEKVEQEARALNLFVGRDWGDRPCLNEWDAFQLCSGLARRQADADAAWRSHQEQTEVWEQQRRAVYLDAHQAAFAAAGGPRGGRAADSAGEAAGDRAVATWQRRHPAPRWQGEQTAPIWRRVADAVVEAVR